MSILIREGDIIPHLKLGRFEIGGGIFTWKTPLAYIIKKKETDGIEDPLVPLESPLPIYSSIGFKGFRVGAYIKYYHKRR